MAKINNYVLNILQFAIKLYQWMLRPIKRPCCRFYPSCSDYALGALKHLGPFKGSVHALRRILRCHPWSLGGYDPVIQEQALTDTTTSKDKEKM